MAYAAHLNSPRGITEPHQCVEMTHCDRIGSIAFFMNLRMLLPPLRYRRPTGLFNLPLRAERFQRHHICRGAHSALRLGKCRTNDCQPKFRASLKLSVACEPNPAIKEGCLFYRKRQKCGAKQTVTFHKPMSAIDLFRLFEFKRRTKPVKRGHNIIPLREF